MPPHKKSEKLSKGKNAPLTVIFPNKMAGSLVKLVELREGALAILILLLCVWEELKPSNKIKSILGLTKPKKIEDTMEKYLQAFKSSLYRCHSCGIRNSPLFLFPDSQDITGCLSDTHSYGRQYARGKDVQERQTRTTTSLYPCQQDTYTYLSLFTPKQLYYLMHTKYTGIHKGLKAAQEQQNMGQVHCISSTILYRPGTQEILRAHAPLLPRKT